MNWAKGIKYLGYLFLGVGILILGTIVKDDPEKSAKLIMELVIFPDPEVISDFPDQSRLRQIRTVFLTLFSLIGIGVVLLVFGLGADREKE